MLVESFNVVSPNLQVTEDAYISKYQYQSTKLSQGADGKWEVRPHTQTYDFKTQRTVPKLGVMLVGWGGNNGTTLTAGILANKQ